MTLQDWQPYLEIFSFNIRPPWKVYRFVARAAHVNALDNRWSRGDLALVINLSLYRSRRTQLPSKKVATAYRRHPIWLQGPQVRKGFAIDALHCRLLFMPESWHVCSSSAKQWLPSVSNGQLKAAKSSITTLDSPTGWKSSPEKIFQQRRRRQQQTAEPREHRLAKRRQPRQQDTEARQRQNKQTNRCKRNRWRERGGPIDCFV